VSGAFVAATGAGTLAAVVTVLILAFAKGWFVILDFMEMRGTDGLLKPALLAWPALLLALALVRSILVCVLFLQPCRCLPNRKEGFRPPDRTVASRDAGEGNDQPHYRRGNCRALSPANERTKGWQNA